MLKSSGILALLLVACLTISDTVQSASTGGAGGRLQRLCAESGGARLRTLDDLAALAAALDDREVARASGCSGRTMAALRELAVIGADRQACSMDKARAVVEFTNKYLKQESNAESGELIPAALRKFAVAYGMKVSATCKAHMIDEFVVDAYDRIDGRVLSISQIEQFTRLDGPLDRLLSPITKTGEFVLPSDLNLVAPKLDTGKIYLSMHNSAYVDRVKRICERQLEPLYEPLLMPIALLARAGYNHNNMKFKTLVALYPSMSKHAGFWTRVVFLCESLKGFECVEADKSKPCDSVETLSDEKVQARKRKLVEEKRREYPKDNDIKYMERFRPKARMSNPIVDDLDLTLKSSINSFNTTQNEVERLQEKLLRSSFNLLRERAKYGEHKPLIKGLIRKALLKSGRPSGEKNLETLTEEMIELVATNKEVSTVHDVMFFVKLHIMVLPLVGYIYAMNIVSACAYIAGATKKMNNKALLEHHMLDVPITGMEAKKPFRREY